MRSKFQALKPMVCADGWSALAAALPHPIRYTSGGSAAGASLCDGAIGGLDPRTDARRLSVGVAEGLAFLGESLPGDGISSGSCPAGTQLRPASP